MILVMVYVLCVYLWKMDSFNLLGNKINYYLIKVRLFVDMNIV